MIKIEYWGIIPILLIWKFGSMLDPEKVKKDTKFRYLRNSIYLFGIWLFSEMATYWWFY